MTCSNMCDRYVDSSEVDGIGSGVVFSVVPLPSNIIDTRDVTVVVNLFELDQPVLGAPIPEDFDSADISEGEALVLLCVEGPMESPPNLRNSAHGLMSTSGDGIFKRSLGNIVGKITTPGSYELKLLVEGIKKASTPGNFSGYCRKFSSTFKVQSDSELDRPDGWVFSYQFAGRASLSRVQPGSGIVAKSGALIVPVDILTQGKTVTSRRAVSPNVADGSIYCIYSQSTGLPTKLAKVTSTGAIVPQGEFLDLQVSGLIAISVDAGRDNIWMVFDNKIVVANLTSRKVLRTINVMAKDIAVDNSTGGAWTFSKEKSNTSKYVLTRYGLSTSGSDDLKVQSILDASGPLGKSPRACLEPLSTGEVVVNAKIGTAPALVRVGKSGVIEASNTNADTAVTMPYDLSVNQLTKQLWVVHDHGNRVGLSLIDENMNNIVRQGFKGYTPRGEFQVIDSIDVDAATGEPWVVGTLQIRDPISGQYNPHPTVVKQSPTGQWEEIAFLPIGRAPFVRTF